MKYNFLVKNVKEIHNELSDKIYNQLRTNLLIYSARHLLTHLYLTMQFIKKDMEEEIKQLDIEQLKEEIIFMFNKTKLFNENTKQIYTIIIDLFCFLIFEKLELEVFHNSNLIGTQQIYSDKKINKLYLSILASLNIGSSFYLSRPINDNFIEIDGNNLSIKSNLCDLLLELTKIFKIPDYKFIDFIKYLIYDKEVLSLINSSYLYMEQLSKGFAYISNK
jgi:hypothetical protein